MTERWTGHPLSERCETQEFFEKNKKNRVYRETSKPLLPETLRCQFLCEGVFTHRSTRVLYAVGLHRTAANRPWNPYPVLLTVPRWNEGWEEIELTEEAPA